MSETIDRCVEAVQSSVKWLDKNKPDWALQIDLELFEFIDNTKCIAGQLCLTEEEEAESSGFDSPLSSGDDDLSFSYSFMDSIWRVFVEKRLQHTPQVATKVLL